MAFQSVLFEPSDAFTEMTEVPVYFRDLNLDQITEAVTAGKGDYDLLPLFYSPAGTCGTIRYRQEIASDLESASVLGVIQSFARGMKDVRMLTALSGKLYHRYNKQGWYLKAVIRYCNDVKEFSGGLRTVSLHSKGLRGLRDYLTDYLQSERFLSLNKTAEQLNSDLLSIRYCIHIKGNCVRIRKYDSETDYSQDVMETFQKFRQGAVKDHLVPSVYDRGMSDVESRIIDQVAKLYPELFSGLDEFCQKNQGFPDETIRRFDREIQLFVSYLEYIAPLKQSGLCFCYPEVSADSKEIFDKNGFDLLLAKKLLQSGAAVVCNSFRLTGRERAMVVTGPNQGGKTTFARAFGQIQYLAVLGLPVPGTEAGLFLFDNIYTHFEREENISNLSGKLQDDLLRIHEILSRATSNSIIIMNEIFSSTTLQDAIFLGTRVMEQIDRLDLLCVLVTFIDELATRNKKTVSMVGTIVPGRPDLRTYKIMRKPPDGLAYALSVAEKYRLTYRCIEERIHS